MPQFSFKSYCWSVGTTSFRTVDFNVRIERQLALLDEFWALPENANKSWQDVQFDYYYFMQERKFVTGDAPNPKKDAREKTSGLVAIGLTNSERRLTPAGTALLNLSQSGNFDCDNLLQLAADSFIYLKQMLKTSCNINGDIVRPFVITAYALLRLEYLTDEEFTYLIPLCTNPENMETIICAIENSRNGSGSINDTILSRLMSMENYRAARDYFNLAPVTERVVTAVGMNRKSGAIGVISYDKSYYPFYEILRDIITNRNGNAVLALYEQSRKINNKPGTLWRQYLFNTSSRRKLEQDGLAALNDVPLLRTTSETDFKRLFFEQMHLFKAKANLSDYADLNRRYFKTTDTMIFADGRVTLDVLPKCWLDIIANELLDVAFTQSEQLQQDIGLVEIAPFLEVDTDKLYTDLERIYGVKITTAAEATAIVTDERYKRLNALIDERFDKTALIDLLSKFEQREDNEIRRLVTNNADIPTIFEYVLGIAWYQISDRKGDVLSYMNLSLEADLLPKTHASGGNADIEYLYENTAEYPAHCLLIEATLTDSSNQRRMEMEPVSRHLGEYILDSGDESAYAVFISTKLHRNVVSDFRNRRTYQYYSDRYEKCVDGLKILPIATSEIRTILKKGIGYGRIYALLEEAHRSNEPVPTWYEKEIVNSM
jgi:hypothetical protein